jgi:hypothetical protein
MAKIVIQNETDPCIAVVLKEVPHGPASTGHSGACTECGEVMYHRQVGKALTLAQEHVDSHEPVTIGGDRDSLIR